MTSSSAAAAALLLVDAQYDFLDGSLAVPGGLEVIEPIRTLLDARWGWRVVATSQDWHPRDHISFAVSHPGNEPFKLATVRGKGGVELQQMMWPVHCVQGTRGAEIHERIVEGLAPWRDGGKVLDVRKGDDTLVEAYSAFDGSTADGKRLDEKLRALGVTHLYVAGVATDFCVRASIMSAVQLGFDVTLVPEAVRAVREEDAAAATREMAEAGVKVVTLAELAATW